MDIEKFSFGSIRIDGTTYEHDVIIDRGKVSKRKKKASKEYRGRFGHTPLSLREDIPWKCKRLIVGTGAHGALPVMEEIEREAKDRDVELIVLPTERAIDRLKKMRKDTNAVLHVTC
ncbi:MAG: MTH938/NDUFAF3 family protein [Vulcanimicrobiaceae bacterium]